MAVMINETEYQRMKAASAEKDATISYLRDQLKELQDAHDSTVNEILNLAPECWDGDAYAGSIAVDFVRSLIEGTTTQPGHRDDCTCFE
jgi:hypothetical protein